MTAARTVATPVGQAPMLAGPRRGVVLARLGIGQPGVWGMVGGFLVIDLIWGARAGLSIGGWGFGVGVIGPLLAISAAYRRRSARLAVMAETGALWLAFTATGCVLTYLAATVVWPLQDPVLTRLDHALGFDWLAWRTAVLARPVLHLVLVAAYMSLLPQMALS